MVKYKNKKTCWKMTKSYGNINYVYGSLLRQSGLLVNLSSEFSSQE